MERSPDRNLLFGLIALRNGLIGPTDLHPSLTRSTGLLVPSSTAERLIASGVLDGPEQSTIEAMIDCLLQRYEGDTRAMLAALDPDSTFREAIARASGPDSDTTLNYVGSDEDDREPGFVAANDRSEEDSDEGRYREFEEIGRGGLGIVYQARDRVLRRDVALKRIRDRRADDPLWQRRFRREAELTGGLQHPGIVPIYDLGTDPDGRPYYVMRQIEGQTFGELVADFHRGRAGRDSGAESLGLRRLLRHFLDLCNAIDYAHGRGILHRDIKPDNVLVGRHGETIVVDWGLAKSMGTGPAEEADAIDPSGRGPADGSDATKSGSVYGTPAYMAPEQANARPLGRPADVYALGSTLYHLLTGRAPFRGPASEVLEAVRLGEFAPPRHHDPTIHRALEAVCLKAMALNPEDRYPTAAALADDVERWLADEPVLAHPDPWAVRASRWARRHRPFVAAAAATVAVAVVGLAIFSGLLWAEQRKTEAARLDAIAQKGRAEAEADRAEAHFGIASDMAEDLSRIVDRNETGQGLTRLTLQQRKVELGRVLATFRKLGDSRPDDTELMERLERLLRFTANQARFVDQHDLAADAYTEAVHLAERRARLLPETPEAKDRFGQILRDQATFLKGIGKLTEADAAIGRSIAMTEELAAANAEDYRWSLAIALITQSGIEWVREHFEDSAALTGRAASLIDEHLAPGGKSPHHLARLFHAMARLEQAMALRDGAGPADAAMASLDAAVAEYEILAATDKDPDVVHNAAIALLERARSAIGHPERQGVGLDDLDLAVVRWQELSKTHGDVPRYRQWLADALTVRGRLRGSYDDRAKGATFADLEAARTILENLTLNDRGHPAYRALLGETWVGLARVAEDDANGREVAVDRAMSSFRAAANRDGENPRHLRRNREIEAEWPEVARIVLEKRRAGQRP